MNQLQLIQLNGYIFRWSFLQHYCLTPEWYQDAMVKSAYRVWGINYKG